MSSTKDSKKTDFSHNNLSGLSKKPHREFDDIPDEDYSKKAMLHKQFTMTNDLLEREIDVFEFKENHNCLINIDSPNDSYKNSKNNKFNDSVIMPKKKEVRDVNKE
jgi:hypothetical protein